MKVEKTCQITSLWHSQWNRFEDEVDNVVLLSIRLVGTGLNSDEQLIEGYIAEELTDMQLKDPTFLQFIKMERRTK